MEEHANPIDLVKQKEAIIPFFNKKVKKGDTWYIIDSKWFKQWKKYVGFDSWDSGNVGDPTSHPGPIDNSNILKNESSEDLKDHLIEDLDYVLLPEDGWNALYSWYGLTAGQTPIERKVVELGLFVKQCKVEIYLTELKFCKVFDTNRIETWKFSKIDTIETVEKVARQLFDIPPEVEIRLWNRYSSSAIERLENKDASIQDSGFNQGQTIIIELKTSEGSWPIKSKRPSKSPINVVQNSPDYQSETVGPGLCGLSNLGNTCFMNAALQCMSNTPPLTQYFTEDKYWEELNTVNPLGMRGEIAKSYADLIKMMWSGRYTYTVPRNFKTIVGRFAPQFSGYQQQDCQELMAFLLDGLHEDLNKVKKKPYIEIRDAEGRPDNEVAKESWENYLKRNNSIIVETFHGLLKSTLVCPDCDKVSVTFDPFCYLSLPLPDKKDRSFEAIFIPWEPDRRPLQLRVIVPKTGCVLDLCRGISRVVGIPSERFLVIDVYNSRFHKLFRNEESLSEIFDRDDIFVYEIPSDLKGEANIIIPVYLREKEYIGSRPSNLPRLFGHPFLLQVSANDNYDQLYERILDKMSRYVHRPDINDHWWLEDSLEGSNTSLKSEDIDLNQVSEDELLTEINEEIGKQVHHRLFTITSVNTFGNVTMEVLKDDGQPLNIGFRTYLAADWHPIARLKFYDEVKAREFDIHESMRMSFAQRKSAIQLSECLELFTSTERLGIDDPWYCSVCKKHQQATKKFDLWMLPKILIIHLKRFSYSRYWRDKLDSLVEFPMYGLNMDRYVINPHHGQSIYDLIAVANHYGGMGGGHYTAYAKNKNTGGWYHFDDSTVTAASEKQPISKAAYVLFYQKRPPANREPHSMGILDSKVPKQASSVSVHPSENE